MSKTIISLTTIPPRMGKIGPTLQSLLEQDAAIDEIVLWIPRTYRRTDFGNFDLPDLPAGITLRRCETDYGPATKVLPAVDHYRGQDVRVIYCDDDRIYHRNWAAHLLAESDRHPGECIAEAGEVVKATHLKSFGTRPIYRLLTVSTLGIYGHFHRKAIRGLDPGNGLVDICKGYGGVLIRPEFFAQTAFDIPELLWTVDDFWLSGQLALNGIPIRKVSHRENSTKTESARVSALIDFVHGEHDRVQANLACIRYFQKHYGIWQP